MARVIRRISINGKAYNVFNSFGATDSSVFVDGVLIDTGTKFNTITEIPPKAYMLGIRDDPDQGNQVVFAHNATDAKNQIDYDQFVFDRWIDIECLRSKRYDPYWELDAAHLALEQWKDGWRWFDIEYPDPDEATDEEFLWWYHVTFDRKK